MQTVVLLCLYCVASTAGLGNLQPVLDELPVAVLDQEAQHEYKSKSIVMYLLIYLSLYLSLYMYVYVYISIYLSIYIYLFIYLSIYVFIHISIFLSI